MIRLSQFLSVFSEKIVLNIVFKVLVICICVCARVCECLCMCVLGDF